MIPHWRWFQRDDSAVSNVVAAILTFALIVTVLVVIRVEFVPVIEKDREAEHMQQVQGEFMTLRAEADRQSLNRTTGVSVTTPITLSDSERTRFFSGSGMPGSLRFDPRIGEPASLSTDELLIFSENGDELFGIDEEWQVIADQQTVEDIVHIQHLRIRANNPGSIAGPPHNQDKGGLTLTVRDADGQFAGDIRLYVISHPSGYNVNARVRDATSTVLYDQGTAHFSQDTPAMYWIDALSSERQFQFVLAKAAKPMTLEWTLNGLTGHYTLSYLADTPDGTVQKGGSGLVVADWESTQGGGMLGFSSQNRYFLDQRVHLEHGALILEQGDGATMIGPPHFRVAVIQDQTQITFTSIGLSGDRNEIESGRHAAVETVTRHQMAITGAAAAFTWDYPTRYGDLWAELWRERLGAAGLDESAGEFVIDLQPGRATLTLYGKDADPTSEDRDLRLTIRQSTLQVVLPP